MIKKLLLIDTNALIHRAYHALPPLTSPNGKPVGALYGLATTILKVLREERPTHIAAAFDRPEPTFRKKLFDAYKAHRPPAEHELIEQIIESRNLVERFGIPFFEQPGYEADDVIGTLVEKFSGERGVSIVILTGDLDTLQLVEDDRVVVRTLRKGLGETLVYNDAAIRERYGIVPSQIPDYKGLVGDPSDNIPGVRGIGPKAAARLLSSYQTIEAILNAQEPRDPAARKVIEAARSATLSKQLATIDRAVPLTIDLDALSFTSFKRETFIPYLKTLGFQSLLKRLEEPSQPDTVGGELTQTPPAIFVDNLTWALTDHSMLTANALKVALDWKGFLKELGAHHTTIRPPLFDITVASWLIDPDQNDFSVTALARRFLTRQPAATRGDQSVVLRQLFTSTYHKLRSYDLLPIFERIEMPLIPVLAAMERWGIEVNATALAKLSGTIERGLRDLARDIFRAAGTRFNLNSPRQVAEVLFEKLSVPMEKRRRTATGQRRTGRDVLLTLKDKHPIINLMLRYREDYKVYSGFLVPLRSAVAADGRVRTTFMQTGTATGRLTSAHPNLQNIPRESRWASAVRAAFQAAPGWSFLAFDYSQLELRLLAHLSGDFGLRQAFLDRRDIHTLTASRIFNVSIEDVSEAMRRTAKTLNFGIIYGMGPRSFAQTSGVSLGEAKRFIDEYHERFSAVRDWQERVKAEARTFGFIKNANGRRRWFIDVAKTESLRGDRERSAINMPIQSFGADIVKLAMVRSYEWLDGKHLLGDGVRLLLSIHDELLFEVRDDILNRVMAPLQAIIEGVQLLSVPLIAQPKVGKHWNSMVPAT